MKFFDSHCHLQFDAFDGLRDKIVDEIIKNDSRVINVGSSIENSESGVLLSKKYPGNLFSSVGVHPFHSLGFEIYKDKEENVNETKYPQDLELLRGMIGENVKAIGECGIDFSYLKDLEGDKEGFKKMQIECFKFQIKLAQEFNLPLILHVRKEYVLALEILKEMGYMGKAVFHFFKGKYSDFEEIVKNENYFFGFSNVITYDDSMDKVILNIPLERLLVETDAPYVAPLCKKGEINEPKNVFYVAEKIGSVLGVDTKYILDISYNNANRFFGV